MRAWVGVTDWDWYQHLIELEATEVNFWQPSGGRRFVALSEGEPFFFKSHYARGSRIIGAGFFSGWASLAISTAWEVFGEANGCSSFPEMRARIARYRRTEIGSLDDPEIGCVMLDGVRYFRPEEAPPAPPGWSSNIVQGRGYDGDEGAEYLADVLAALVAADGRTSTIGAADLAWPQRVPGPVFVDGRVATVRVGQRAFRALVQQAYDRRCAVTGDKIVPVLEAAHIKPVSVEGENRLDNGLLLRSDVHTLFDRGYLGVHPEQRTLMVSPGLRRRWGNGEEFYTLERIGRRISEPTRALDRPNRDFLEWHADTVFLRT